MTEVALVGAALVRGVEEGNGWEGSVDAGCVGVGVEIGSVGGIEDVVGDVTGGGGVGMGVVGLTVETCRPNSPAVEPKRHDAMTTNIRRGALFILDVSSP